MEQLPPPLLAAIASRLCARDLASLCAASSRLRQALSRRSSLWAPLLARRFGPAAAAALSPQRPPSLRLYADLAAAADAAGAGAGGRGPRRSPPRAEPPEPPEQPLSFEDALCERCAAPLRSLLRAGVSKLRHRARAGAAPSELSLGVKSLLADAARAMRECPRWSALPDAVYAAQRMDMQRYVFRKLYRYLFERKELQQRDREFGDKVNKVRGTLTLEYLEVAEAYHDHDILDSAQRELEAMDQQHHPEDKLTCIFKCCTMLIYLLQGGGREAGADEFLPLFIYVVVQSNTHSVISNLEYESAREYIGDYETEQDRGGELYCYYAHLYTAVTFVSTHTPEYIVDPDCWRPLEDSDDDAGAEEASPLERLLCVEQERTPCAISMANRSPVGDVPYPIDWSAAALLSSWYASPDVDVQRLQFLQDKAARDNSMRGYLEYGAYVFLHGDFFFAKNVLTLSLERTPSDPSVSIPTAYLVRGLCYHHLCEYDAVCAPPPGGRAVLTCQPAQAVADYLEALGRLRKLFGRYARPVKLVPDGQHPLPAVCVADILCCTAAAKLFALVHAGGSKTRDQRQDLAAQASTLLDEAAALPLPQQRPVAASVLVLRGLALFYVAALSGDRDGIARGALARALGFFDEAIARQPDSHEYRVMRVHTLALLGCASEPFGRKLSSSGRRETSTASAELESVTAANPGVWHAILSSPQHLLECYWPGLQQSSDQRLRRHDFERERFHVPTWCDHCTEWVREMTGKQGHRCAACGYTIHAACYSAALRQRNCWKAAMASLRGNGFVALPPSHIHQYREIRIHKPMSCDACLGVLLTPLSIGYVCTECCHFVHKSCLAQVPRRVILTCLATPN
eukprot:m51a1_g10694 hypothetical protein (856) ;mRNA; f:139062-143184